MRLFALDTDLSAVKRRFMSEGEQELMIVYHHGLFFAFAVVREAILTLIIIGLGILGYTLGLRADFIAILSVLWVIFVFAHMLKAYLDWCNDILISTSDKVILIDQTSIFKRTITPISLENFASIVAVTQFFNIFPFGKIVMNLKEGVGDKIILEYIPDHQHVAACISGCVTQFQRRRTQQASEQQ